MKNFYFLMVLFVWVSCTKKNPEIDFCGEDIEEMIAKMSIEEKVGQMTQINLDVISKGEVYNLIEPHEIDPEKLDVAVNKYFVGSIQALCRFPYNICQCFVISQHCCKK